MSSFAHTFDLKKKHSVLFPMWMDCACREMLDLILIFLCQLAQARPHNVLHFLVNGWENSGGSAFAASVKPFVQHGRASSKYFGERHSWPSYLQADLVAACRRDTNLGTGGGQQP